MSLKLTIDEMQAQLTELGLDLHRIWRHTPDEIWGRLDESIDEPDLQVVHFSMEYMLSEALPIYSGGLGNVAGDHLKAASDLGVPIIGIGLLYQQGYFRQMIDAAGDQRAVHPYNDPSQLPISPVRDHNGEWVRVTVPFAGSPIAARAWQVRVGRSLLYLLDANIPSNRPDVRGITSELYGGGPETRLAQEILLGIGGVRLLDALGLEPTVFHLNEGHAAFAALERARRHAESAGCGFDQARAVTRAGNLFTTHTPVEAGFDRFPTAMVARYLGRYLLDEVGVEPAAVLAAGTAPGADDDTFNMAYFAVRWAGAVNGVSELHGQVSRQLFAPLFPRWPLVEIPVASVTNGIHVPTWDDSRAHQLWERVAQPGSFVDGLGRPAEGLASIGDGELWETRSAARSGLVGFVRARWAQQLADGGADEAAAEAGSRDLFDSNALTIGFARRFAEYKRPNLLLRDPDRLARLLSDTGRPVQMIVAGKAHPQDGIGRGMVREWVEFSRRPDVEGSVVFLADYDMLLTRQLVQGVDLWVNTPRRPWEASGTSGMKILANGGLNLSIADGWWAEAHRPGRGWLIDDDGTSDEAAAESLYRLLEDDVVPRFYDRDEHGVPARWVAMMRESMRVLTPLYSADRMVREYTERFYLPLADAHRRRAADGGSLGQAIQLWQQRMAQQFARVHVSAPEADESGLVQLFAHLGELSPDEIAIELYADATSIEDPPTIVEMQPIETLVGVENGFRFVATLSPDRPLEHHTARVRARFPGAVSPIESPFIRWVGVCTLTPGLIGSDR